MKHQSAPSALETLDCMGDTPKPETDRNTWSSDVTRVARRASEYDSSFEQDLRQSRVYTRISRNIERSDPDMLSLPSSTRRSIGYSFLSGMSLADVSDISLISLPIPIQSLSNRQRYQGPIVTSLPSKYSSNGSDHVTRSSGKILLLGKPLMPSCIPDLLLYRHFKCRQVHDIEASAAGTRYQADPCRDRGSPPRYFDWVDKYLPARFAPV